MLPAAARYARFTPGALPRTCARARARARADATLADTQHTCVTFAEPDAEIGVPGADVSAAERVCASGSASGNGSGSASSNGSGSASASASGSASASASDSDSDSVSGSAEARPLLVSEEWPGLEFVVAPASGNVSSCALVPTPT